MEQHDRVTGIKEFIIVIGVTLGVACSTFATPTAQAQTLYETLVLAVDAEAAAKKLHRLANKLDAMVENFAANKPLLAMAPAKTALFDQRAKAARTAMLRQARAYEWMAATLRAQARTLR